MDLSFLCQLEGATLCKFTKGECLVQQGDPLDYIYYLTEGVCERIELSEDGGEVLFNKKMPNDGPNSIVGLNTLWAASAGFCYVNTFVAITDVVCYRIDAVEAKKALQKCPEALDEILSTLSQKYLTLKEMYKSRQERRAPNQLCALLLKNIVITAEGMYINKKLKNVEISRQLNIHPVTVAKIMSFLQKEDILQRTSNGIKVLDFDRLVAYVDEKMEYL